MDNLFQYLALFNIAWFSLLIIASVVHRRAKGRPILSWSVPGARYFHRFASGHSHKSFFTKLGGASNCLIVAVTNDRLIVRPFFPFTLMFLPEFYALDVDVPLSSVEGAELKKGALHQRVHIWFRDSDGQRQEFTVMTKEPDKLLSFLPSAEFVKQSG